MKNAIKKKEAEGNLSAEERAKNFLLNPRLLDEVLDDLALLGLVGESTNKQIVYLCASSRKLHDPIGLVLHSSSSSGKTVLANTIAKLIPPEEVFEFSKIRYQALNYIGRDNPDILKNKVILVTELQGVMAKEVSYVLRQLLTEHKHCYLTTKKGLPEWIHLNGPVSFISTTTKEFDEEVGNRILGITLDESKEQTSAIQTSQKRLFAGNGLNGNTEILLQKHHLAQKMLNPCSVVIPFAEHIRFPANKLRARRDHMKFLNLISAVAFLYQYQREKTGENGMVVKASVADYKLAYELYKPLFEELNVHVNPIQHKLMLEIQNFVSGNARKRKIHPDAVTFTRGDVVNASSWTLRQVRTHVDELVDNEFLTILQGSKGRTYKYRLNNCFLNADTVKELATPEELEHEISSNEGIK